MPFQVYGPWEVMLVLDVVAFLIVRDKLAVESHPLVAVVLYA